MLWGLVNDEIQAELEAEMGSGSGPMTTLSPLEGVL
jgi:hypothetical protein